MKPHRHELRCARAFLVEAVKRCCEVPVEIVGTPNPWCSEIPGVVSITRVGYDKPRTAKDCHVVGKFIIMRIRIVDKSALLRQEPPCSLAGAVPAKPTNRPFADTSLDRCDSGPDVVSLLLFRHPEVLTPSIAMPTGFVAELP